MWIWMCVLLFVALPVLAGKLYLVRGACLPSYVWYCWPIIRSSTFLLSFDPFCIFKIRVSFKLSDYSLSFCSRS